MLGLSIVEVADRYGDVIHLLQTESLGAELQLVCIVSLGSASLVLHRCRLPSTRVARVTKVGLPLGRGQLHDVGDSIEPQPV